MKKDKVVSAPAQLPQASQALGVQPVGSLMRRYALPCIVSLLVGALYNIVDQIFIANASYLGSYGNAANTVVFPLTVVALAVAVMVGDGCCAYVSISLGQGQGERAKRSVGNAVVLSLVSGLLLAALYLVFFQPIIAMFGGTVNQQTFDCAQEYFFYITLGLPFYMFGQANEILSDRNFYRGGHGRRLHFHCGLQHGRGKDGQGQGVAYPAAVAGGVGGRGGFFAGGVLPRIAHCHIRRGQ